MNFRNFATAMMFLAAAAVHGADAWKPAAGNPVLSRGSFLNIHSPAVLAEDGQYTLFFSGYWGALEIFRARSADGTAFTPEKSPAVPRDPEGQPGSWNVIGSPSVLKENGIYHIWFAGAPDWNTPAAIGYASSPDGVTFSKYPGNAVLAATRSRRPPCFLRTGGSRCGISPPKKAAGNRASVTRNPTTAPSGRAAPRRSWRAARLSAAIS